MLKRAGVVAFSLMRVLVVVTGVATLVACVTTTENAIYTNTEVDEAAAVSSHVSAAREYLQSADHENALRHLRKAMDIDPDSAEVHSAMAYAFELSLDRASVSVSPATPIVNPAAALFVNRIPPAVTL